MADVLTKDDLVQVSKEFLGYPGKRVYNFDDVIGMESILTIAKDTVLWMKMLRPVPDVHYGDKVFIIVKNGVLEIKIKGELLDDGRIGDVVRVRSGFKSGKIIEGTVIDRQHVQASFLN